MNKLKPALSGLILLLIVLVFASSPLTGKLKIGLLNTIKLPLTATNFISSHIREILNYRSLAKDNQELRREAGLLNAELIELKEASQENERLRGLLSFKKKVTSKSLPALVIGRDSSNWSSTLLINKGKRDGLAVNMPVVSFRGLLGKTVEVGPSLAKVILLTHPDFRIEGRVQRTREEGLIHGGVNKKICLMKYLPRDSEVSVGDLVVSSGRGEIYPKGLLIGKISGVSVDNSRLYKNAFILPAVNLSKVEEVLIITGEK